MPHARTVRRRLAPEDRRAEIVDAATTLIAERGYSRLTLSDLADRSGITRAGLAHYFASKESVFVAVLEARDAADEYSLYRQTGFTHRGSPPETVEEFLQALDRLVALNARRREIVRLYTVLDAEALSEDHPAHAYFRRRFALARLNLARAMQWHPDPGAAAVQVHSYLDGIQLDWLRDADLDLEEMWGSYAALLRGAWAA